MAARPAESSAKTATGRQLIHRHSLLVRITHWINVVCILILLMSGLQIFNAHPALYIGQQSDFAHPLFRIAGFPAWATLPGYQDLATGRRWHLFFAWLLAVNGAIYVIASLADRHVWRDLVPSGTQLRGIGRSIGDHMRLRFRHGRGYNVLQKLTYLAMVFAVLPVMILAGMALSPGLDAAFPWLVDLFGGRQTARSVHFFLAATIVLFVIVHVAMVAVSGPWNNLRSMITGRYAVDARGADDDG